MQGTAPIEASSSRAPPRRALPKYLHPPPEPVAAAAISSTRPGRSNTDDPRIEPEGRGASPEAGGSGKQVGRKGQAARPGSRTKVEKACVYCKRSHMTCERARPCQRCVKRGIPELCTDDRPGQRGRPKGSRNVRNRHEKKSDGRAAESSPSIDDERSRSADQNDSGMQPSPPRRTMRTARRQGDHQVRDKRNNQDVNDDPMGQREDSGSGSEPFALDPTLLHRSADQLLDRSITCPTVGHGDPPITLGTPIERLLTNDGEPVEEMMFNWSSSEVHGQTGQAANDMLEPWIATAAGQGSDGVPSPFWNLASQVAQISSSSSAKLDDIPMRSPSSQTSHVHPEPIHSLQAGASAAQIAQYQPPSNILPSTSDQTNQGPAMDATVWGLSDHLAQVEHFFSLNDTTAPGDGPGSLDWLIKSVQPGQSNTATKSPPPSGLAARIQQAHRQQDRTQVSRSLPLSHVRNPDVEDENLPLPWNYTYSYAKVNRFISRHWSPTSIERVSRVVSTLRPYFLTIIHARTDFEIDAQTRTFQTVTSRYERDVFPFASCPTLVWRRTGEIVGANDRMAELLQMDKSKLTLSSSLTLYEILDEDSAVRMIEDYGHCVYPTMPPAKPIEGFTKPIYSQYTIDLQNCTTTPSNSASQSLELRILSRSQLTIKCATSLMVYIDAYGIPVVVVGTFTPITSHSD